MNGDIKRIYGWRDASSSGTPFYVALETKKNQFDDFVEQRCAKFYAPRMGRPSLEPGAYFRLLLVGYFEGLGSERGIAWRAADSWGCAN